MAQKPHTLKIGAHTYAVRYEEFWEGDDDELAHNDPMTQVIQISSQLSPTQTFVTLLHEAMHTMNRTLDHTVLDSLAEQVGQFLLDNGLSEPFK